MYSVLHSRRGVIARKTVLLVDDDALVLRAVVRRLAKEGYEVVTAHTGEEALSILRADGAEIDVVVSDYRMPGIDGVQLLDHVRRVYPGKGRILHTSSCSPPGSNEHGYIAKPTDGNGLLEAIERELAK